MSRLLAIAYIVLCFELGMLLFFFPWVSAWTKNYFVEHYPLVSGLTRNYFFRGGVSGLGLADIWLACFEFWRLRGVLGLGRPRPRA